METLWVLAYAAVVVGFGYWASEYNRNPIGWGFLFVVAPLVALILLPLLGPIKKNKYCPECGAPNDPETGTCPRCNGTIESKSPSQPKQVPKAGPEANKRKEPTVELNETNKSTLSDHGTSGVVAINPEEFSLDIHKVVDLIETRAPFVENHGNDATELLSKFKIVDYLSTLHIKPRNLNGELCAPSAVSYFGKQGYQYLHELNPSSPATKEADSKFVEIYETTRKFEHPFSLSFFEGFVVIEIHLPENQYEFLVLAPEQSPEYEGMGALGGLLSGFDVTQLFDVLITSRRNLCVFAVLVDDILAELSRSTTTAK